MAEIGSLPDKVGNCPHTAAVVGLPGVLVRRSEGDVEIDFDRNPQRAGRTGRESETGVRRSAAGEDAHDRPVTCPEDPTERLFVGGTRVGRMARVRMQPDPGELVGRPTGIDLPVEMIGDRRVVERDEGRRGPL